ncbi:hypothetical protein HY992_02505 [Candidatus Micrarchaeota archaeon]|nr:hypothetical protein [Candidatus Micrarchaeota archaeon]
MELFYYRGQKSKETKMTVPVFALGHHKPKEEGEDQFTKYVINFYNYGNKTERDYFMSRLLNLFKERFEGAIRLDFVAVIPTREKDKVNSNMQSFTQEFATSIGVAYQQIIRRSRTIEGHHAISESDKRFENVKGSIDVSKDVQGKNILLLDNLCISGANAQEAFDALKRAGAKEVLTLCFGLGSKGKECDFDINPAFKGNIMDTIATFHWPKVPKEKRISRAKP